MFTSRRYFAVVLSALLSAACSPDPGDDAIPYLAFEEVVINLNLPAYQALKLDGGYLYVDGGVRGLIVYRVNPTTYYAFERNCSFQPTEACATVDVDISGLFMLDPCCGSSFSFGNGIPIGGVAWRPLRRYAARLNSETLTITDQVVE